MTTSHHRRGVPGMCQWHLHPARTLAWTDAARGEREASTPTLLRQHPVRSALPSAPRLCVWQQEKCLILPFGTAGGCPGEEWGSLCNWGVGAETSLLATACLGPSLALSCLNRVRAMGIVAALSNTRPSLSPLQPPALGPPAPQPSVFLPSVPSHLSHPDGGSSTPR
ncbi:insulin-like growth factor binding protein 4 [Columba livia]|uniref:Insulin-like growth factor binding protein 4 n=1 Tax=Columba livia TaxID=8932 RepID=A0A2I0LLZ3_COLLI|nr:insulin-like growth factor binding protein 4 [Columba livia]